MCWHRIAGVQRGIAPAECVSLPQQNYSYVCMWLGGRFHSHNAFVAYSAGEQSENLNFFTSYFMRIASIELCHFAAYCQITCCAYIWTQYGLEFSHCLTLILLTWRIWWAPNNASKWQMGFNSAFKGLKILLDLTLSEGWDSSVGIATRYKLEGPGIESPWGGEIFSTCPHRPWGPPSLLYNGYLVFPGGKAAGVWRWPPTPSSAKVKEEVELHLYSLSGPSWPVLGWTLPLPF